MSEAPSDTVPPAAPSSPPPEEWPTDPNQYELIGKIGHGAFATVWKAKTSTVDQRECAVKVLNLDHVDTNLDEIRLEVQAMRLSSHSNVLTCHTAFVRSTNLWLVTQLMRKGSSLHCLQSARRLLHEQGSTKVRMEEHILYILHQTLLGLKYIHDNGQIHRDIKASNILLDHEGNVRIADFGVSGWLVQGGSQLEKAKTFVGTPCWMAPEVMEQVHGYDYKADIWSLGITALELARGYAPYAKYPPMKVLILTIQEDPPSLDSYLDDDEDDDEIVVSEEYSKSFRSMVDTCLRKDPTRRPNCEELLNSKYLKADDTKIEQLRQQLVASVCNLVPDVGEGDDDKSPGPSGAKRKLPGHAPVSIVLNEAADRPAGTTWVFADGSQVLSSSAKTTQIDDVMAELDEFGKQTGGEHYNKKVQVETPAVTEGDGEETNDDLNAFMDEFEQNTAGEDFRR